MAEKRVKFTLKSISPLLMSWDNMEFADLVKEWQEEQAKEKSKKVEKGSDRYPPFTWIGRLYNDGKRVVIPAANLMVSLRQAGALIPIPGGKQKTYKEATQTALLIESEYIDFAGGTEDVKPIEFGPIAKLIQVDDDMKKHVVAVEKMGFKIDIRRAAPQPGKKHIRCRPRFEHWQASGTMLITNPEVISIELLKEIFRLAGERKGLCDWRPGCKTPGQFGRFTAELKAA